MGSPFDTIAESWLRRGPLATPRGQRAALCAVTAALCAFPLLWGRDWVSALAVTALVGLLVVVGGLYLARSERDVWERLRDLAILAVVVVGVVYGSWAMSVLSPAVPVFVLPVALAAVLTTLLLNARVGILVAVMATGVGVLFGTLEGAHVVGSLLASAAGVTAMASIRDRSRLVSAGGLFVVVTALAATGASLLEGGTVVVSLIAGGLGALGGTLTIALVLALLPAFERVFGVTSDVRLLEIADPAHPLLKRLMLEASGTYSHSVMTGNLAEAAAEAIAANRLLARVGAYYHDVGKLSRPSFFVENQSGCANPHDQTSPKMSALLITAHVREGVALAQQYRLPREVTDIIHQHHGTSVVSYFYNKATAGGAPVVEADFRYAGEVPSTRESAVVMLADAVEAAVRAIGGPTPAKIERVVHRVVEGKLADHQLDAADLTLGDVERVSDVFVKMLESVYHSRIEYPEHVEGGDRHAGERHQPSRA